MQRRIRIAGIVQGVGFRPYVWHLANELQLTGWVRNDAAGVEVLVQGSSNQLDIFIQRLPREIPPLAQVRELTWADAPAQESFSTFSIAESGAGNAATMIGHDTAVCSDCLAEMFDPADRRWRYAFINCTHCGPRFTLTRKLPYDRAQTSMAGFPLCPDCAREYRDPANRRFHAEPTACPVCGPKLSLTDAQGCPLDDADPIGGSLKRLQSGQVVAIKGLGGFHLACDARNAQAVQRLRERKHRDEKPFAIMAANLVSIADWVEISPAEAELLQAPERPIVLLRKKPGADAMFHDIAPGLAWLGVMLPYTPQHWLLFHAAAGQPVGTTWMQQRQDMLLVMTSANPGGEPLVIDNEEAVERLAACRTLVVDGDNRPRRAHFLPDSPPHSHSMGQEAGEKGAVAAGLQPTIPKSDRLLADIADALLLHDRVIVARCDDSVVRVDAQDTPLFIRRARGYTPRAIRLPRSGPSVLALGGYLKNTVCVTRGDEAYLSQHIGGLDNAATCGMLVEVVEHLLDILQVQPEAVAHDLHPDFFSSRYALELAERWGVPAITVQHHHAHIAAVAAEHAVTEPILGLALDGVGLGSDGAAWGGELLRVDGVGFTRLGHLLPMALPGGDKAAKEPWRMAASALFQIGRGDEIATRFPHQSVAGQLHQLLERGLNCPPTSSLGRWFDAAAGLLGVREVMAYEGQAAMLLEGLAEAHGEVAPILDAYVLHADGRLDLLPLMAHLADEKMPAFGAALFHITLANALADWTERAAQEQGLSTVAFGGGCFLNHILARDLTRLLNRRGLTVLAPGQAPTNDGGLSLGQAWVAMQQIS